MTPLRQEGCTNLHKNNTHLHVKWQKLWGLKSKDANLLLNEIFRNHGKDGANSIFKIFFGQFKLGEACQNYFLWSLLMVVQNVEASKLLI